ncbi:O-methyltransferase [Desulfocurvibacter africanus PCS]|uniref:O-methyltransferase n=1 Tax=Desulfocurvibacter africanus PCS TaxID=1262666 RepID=M5Q0G3_DESAF|nr:methyltransferase [Desulfocurvibacter africanus]EMG36676.1 O-methyltransferase [Desulfocurvibacter africanus PCS]
MFQSRPELNTPEGIMALAMAFQRSRTLLSAVDLGVFTALSSLGGDSGEPVSSTEVAGRIKADAKATDRLLNALTALGLVRKAHGLFSNTELSELFLVEGREDYLTNLRHSSELYRAWGSLTDAVRKGGCLDEAATPIQDEEWTASFIAAMHRRAFKSAPVEVSKLNLHGVSRLLDVGGGSGVYAMAFAQAKAGVSVTVFDLPPVVRLAEDYIRKAGLSGRVSTRAGDYRTDDLGLAYDLVFLSAVAHINSPEDNKQLMRKAAAALNPGGRIVVLDFIMEPDRVLPERGALFALNMLVNTPAGDTYTEEEIASWLMEAGCRDIERIDTAPGMAMIVGTLPAE